MGLSFRLDQCSDGRAQSIFEKTCTFDVFGIDGKAGRQGETFLGAGSFQKR
jgi:hypothetical protein